MELAELVGHSGSPRIPVLQEPDGVVGALLVGAVDELEWPVGASLEELWVDVSSLDECCDEDDE